MDLTKPNASLQGYQKVIDSFDKGIALKPEDHEAWYNRGFVLYNLGQYQEALGNVSKAIALKPDYHLAWLGKGFLFYHLERYEEAI